MHRTNHKRLKGYKSFLVNIFPVLEDTTHYTGKRINEHPIALPPLPGVCLGPQSPLPAHPLETSAALLPASPSRKAIPYLLCFSIDIPSRWRERRTPEAGSQSAVRRRDGLEAGFRKGWVEPAGFAHVWVIKAHEFKV